MARFNTWLAEKITAGVGTMTCAYIFAAIALISLPTAIDGGTASLVSWVAQTFLQLVLLSIVIVGQNLQAAISEARAVETHDAMMTALGILQQSHAELHEVVAAQLDNSSGEEPKP
jgi:hypothetical protein